MLGVGALKRLLVLDLIPPHLLAGEVQLLGDLDLIDVPAARLTDRAAERQACLPTCFRAVR